jgi:undecaprenyl diphosphate synthase
LTLYTFSTENWNRPRLEVDALMQLLVSTLRKEVANLKQHNIRLHAIGELHALPDRCLAELCQSMEATAHNTGLTLTLALSYGSRQDILQATKTLCLQAQKGLIDPNAITPAHFASALSTHGMPDPELLIRTSGEFRISNFLLWEIAYAELYVTDTLWPDFRKVHLYEALADYQRRERRFGKTSEQIQTEFTK